MKKNLTYSEAYSALEDLVREMEEDDIQLESLAAKVKEAMELVEFCETNLRKVQEETEEALGAKISKTRKKKS